MNTEQNLKTLVREKYTEVAQQPYKHNIVTACGCGPACGEAIMAEDYTQLGGYAPEADLGLGCGLPTQFAQIKEGDTVIDLGSGAGNDAFVARAEVGPMGKVIGIDFTEAMIAKARTNAEKLGYHNVEFRYGDIEQMPVNDNIADVVVSNCVLNLVPNKQQVISEIYRVLKPNGHFSISDIVLVGDLPTELRQVAELYAGCVSGAIQRDEYLQLIQKAGFVNIKIQKQKNIHLPDELLLEYITPESLKAFKESGLGILSVTVYAEKPSTDVVEYRTAIPSDAEHIKALLTSAHLPTEDLNPTLSNFSSAWVKGQLIGTAGIDTTGSIGLLRSVVVREEFRHKGIASQLINDLTTQVRSQGVKTLYLMTTTAEHYFEQQGFVRISRDTVPDEVAHSQQFNGICPSSAVVMKKEIESACACGTCC